MSSDTTVIIELPHGRVKALQRENLVIARGVRYAHAGRFELPRLNATAWDGIVDCTQLATICPQVRSGLEYVTGHLESGRNMDEDCLHVSIATPGYARKSALLPVMVFIHGGAYVSGGGDLDCYSNVPLAAQGVVAVNITYRLGVLGYQPIEGIAPPNLGLLDQLTALRWIQENIESFGGDPSQVCLLGNSAGGDSIYCLLGADGTEGLFHRVIFQSAPFGLRDLDRQEVVEALSSAAADFLSTRALSADMEELFQLQSKLRLAARSFIAGGMPFAPIFGQDPLPEKSVFDSRQESRMNSMPVFIGYTRDEGRPFEALASAIQPLSIMLESTYKGLSARDFVTKVWFHDPADRLVQSINAAGGDVLQYQFNLAPEGTPFGAPHCIELPFLFGTWDAWKKAPMLGREHSRELVEQKGQELKRLWVAFASGRDLGSKQFIIDENFTFPSE